jgi:hypothetical protein
MSRPTTKPKEIFEEHYYRGYKDGRGLKTIRQVIKIDPARGNVLFRNIGGGRDGWEDSLTIKKFIRWLEVEVEKPTETVVKDKPTRVTVAPINGREVMTLPCRPRKL